MDEIIEEITEEIEIEEEEEEQIVEDEIEEEEINIYNEEEKENDKDLEEEEIYDENEIEEKINKKRKTFNIMTKYEKNYILGIRVQQIMNGSPLFIKINEDKTINIFDIAYSELIQKKLPFKIKRKLPNGTIEIWDLNELEIL